MAFEKEELYSVLENASDFIEHSRTKGAYNVKPIKGIRLANGRYLYNEPEKAVPSNPDEWGKGEDAEGIDEYGAYKLSENGEKIYDIGDGIEYDYTDGYFIPRNKPGAPPKKWDDAVGGYVPVSWEREEEVYPDVGEEDKPKSEEKKEEPEPEKKEAVNRTKKEKLIEEDKGKNPPEEKVHPRVTGSDVTTWENAKITSWDKTKDKIKTASGKAKESLDDLWKKVKSGASSMWEKIRNKLRHGETLDEEEYEFLAHNGINTEEDFVAMVENIDDDNFLEHYGVPDQRWGVRNGPPYPLKRDQKPLTQKGAEYVEQRKGDTLDKVIRGASIITDLYGNAVSIYSAIPYEHSKYGQEDLDDTIIVGPKGQKHKDSYGRLERIMASGGKLTQDEAEALNTRKKTLDTLNSNYNTPQKLDRQKTMDALQSVMGLALAGLSVLKTVKEIRNLKSS